MNPNQQKLKYISIGIITPIVLETFIRECNGPNYLRPFFWLKGGSVLASKSYYNIGKFIGWIAYGISICCKFIASKLWESFGETLFSLYDSLKGYFNFGNILDGIKEIAYQYWKNNQAKILIGGTMFITSIPIICYFFPNNITVKIKNIRLLK